jgi:hypothetical protein
MPGQCPSTVRKSLWQTPQASTRTRTCPGPGSATSLSTNSNGLFGPAAWKARDLVMGTPNRELRRWKWRDSDVTHPLFVDKPRIRPY